MPQFLTAEVAWLEPEIPGEGPRTTWMVPVTVIAHHTRMLRIMAAHLRVYFDDGDEDHYALAWMSHGGGFLDSPHQESQAWLWFDSVINKPLGPYRASVNFYPGGTLTGATPMPTLYQACALQLYNCVVEGAAFARCANERCPYGADGEPALFTRQRGRAQYGQHRTGPAQVLLEHVRASAG